MRDDFFMGVLVILVTGLFASVLLGALLMQTL